MNVQSSNMQIFNTTSISELVVKGHYNHIKLFGLPVTAHIGEG
jgi:hypothetical protein